MTNHTNLDRVGQIEDGMSKTQAKATGVIEQFVFQKQSYAEGAAELIGVEEGTFSYTNAEDQTIWFPGKSLEALEKFCRVSPQPKADAGVFKYKDPITQEFYYYEREGVHKKNGKPLVYVEKVESNLAKSIRKLTIEP